MRKSQRVQAEIFLMPVLHCLTAGSWIWFEWQPREEPIGEPLSLPEWSGLGWN